MSRSEKIQTAIAIFKAALPDAKGKFHADVTVTNGNIVDIYNEAGRYCFVNIRSGKIGGI
jgi:adenine deaminase